MGILQWLERKKEERVRRRMKAASELLIMRQTIPQEWRSDILAALSGNDVIARRSAAHAVSAFGGTDVDDALILAMQDGDPNVRCSAAVSFLSLKGEQARSQMENLVATDKSEFVRAEVKLQLERMWPSRGNIDAKISDLIFKLKDSDRWVRESSVREIIALGTPAVEQLIQYLQHPDKWARLMAAAALGKMRDSRSIGPLNIALEDSDEGVRYMAQTALNELRQQ